ncbi:MFS transporter [Sphingomonas oligophenolica]
MAVAGVDEKSGSTHAKAWIGQAPSSSQIFAFLLLGTTALLIAGVQPVVLGALVDEARLSASAVGWTVAIEFVTIGIGVAIASSVWDPAKIRGRVAIAAVVLIVVDLLISRLTGGGILADRAVAGLAEGVLVAPAAIIIARAPTPARWAGILLVLQGVAQFVLAAVLPGTAMKAGGADGAFYVLAAAVAISLLVVPLLPGHMARLRVSAVEHPQNSWTLASVSSLFSVFLTYAYFIGAFSYFGLLARQAGLGLEQVGNVIALTVATSILGSAGLAMVAQRVHYYTIATICLCVNVGLIVFITSLPDYRSLLLAGTAFGFFWGIFTPLQVALVIENDRSRRTALVIPGVQALGAAGGPLLCSAFVTQGDARGAFASALVCLIGAFAISTWLHFRTKPAEPAQ